MQQTDILDAIILQTECHRTHSTPQPIKSADNYIKYLLPPVEIRLTPVIHTNEIELSLILHDTGEKFFQDSIQAWVGQPIRSYMFNENSINIAIKDAVATVGKIFDRLSRNPTEEVRNLEAASQKLSIASSNSWTRQEANRAWSERRYSDVVELYANLEANLTPSESKRLKLSKDYLGRGG